MKQEKSHILEAIIILLVIITWLIGVITYAYAPDIVPIHWNLEGKPDNYAPKDIGLFLLPLINTGLYLFLFFIPKIDPNNEQLQYSIKTLQWIRLGTHALLGFIMLWTSLSIIEASNVQPEWLFSVISLFFAFLGKAMANVKQNYFVGIRTPWTLSNELVWDDTHRFTAPLWFYTGIGMACISAILSSMGFGAGIILTVFLIWIATIVIIPIAYSYKRFREEKKSIQ
ncbi:MAG: SdpI family protein [Candidatus Kapaibacteriota bacterium]